ncbi:MAG: hypothetical protein MJ166_01020 [Clostridia bacterium]|nr:hypothetical protein [Clostridia bacterium]
MKNKRGSGSIFLAIILSALIFVEGIYLSMIIDINRRQTINRALKLQVDTILANYNEELFENYGIYGFFLDDVNEEIYINVIETTGYKYGEDIYIDGYKTINTAQLREAISNYYAYRSPGLLLSKVSKIFEYAIDKFDDSDFATNLKNFKKYGGGKVLNWLSSSADNINDFLSSDELEDLIDLVDDSFLSDFIDKYEYVNSDGFSFDNDFSPADMFSMKFFNETIEIFDAASDFIDDNLFSIFVSHYCVYNFECSVKSFEGELDKNLHGTSFRDLNTSECNDAEYLITGQRGIRAAFGPRIFMMLSLVEIVNLLLDDEFMEICGDIAEVISVILTIVLEGVEIPPWVIEMVIIMIFANFKSLGDLVNLYDGKSITVFEIDEAPEPLNLGIEMDYKDFLFVYSALIVKPERKLDRLENLFEEKYGDICTQIDIGTLYEGDWYYASQGYELYGF